MPSLAYFLQKRDKVHLADLRKRRTSMARHLLGKKRKPENHKAEGFGGPLADAGNSCGANGAED
jgi:hypothetical protein